MTDTPGQGFEVDAFPPEHLKRRFLRHHGGISSRPVVEVRGVDRRCSTAERVRQPACWSKGRTDTAAAANRSEEANQFQEVRHDSL